MILPRHDLIEYQHSAMLFRELAQFAQIALTRWYAAHIACHWLYDDRCDIVAHLVHDPRYRCLIIIGHGYRIRRRSLRHAW